MLLPIQNSISIVQDQAQLKNKEKELKKLNDLLIKLEEKSQEDSKALKIAQDHFHAVSAGLSSNEDGEDKTLADQIMSKSMNFCWLTKQHICALSSSEAFLFCHELLENECM